MAAHVHAEKMAMFAEDAKISETPWEFWETQESKVKRNGVWIEEWEDLEEMPDWHPNVGYRRKVRTTTVAGVEFPLPYTGKIIEGVTYYYADIGNTGYDVHSIKNDGDGYHQALLGVLLNSGNIFLSEEEAKVRVKALRELDGKILGGE